MGKLRNMVKLSQRMNKARAGIETEAKPVPASTGCTVAHSLSVNDKAKP